MPSPRISTLPHRLKTLTDDAVPGQRAAYIAAVSARFPAHQVNGIWHFREADLPAILAAFNLRPKPDAFDHAPGTPIEHAVAA